MTLPGVKLYSLFLGSRNTRSAARFTAADERLLSELTAKHFPSGFTIVAAKGSWWNPRTRRLEREESREIHVSAARLEVVRQWARALGKSLRQDEVLVVEVGRRHVIAMTRRRAARRARK